MEDLGLCMDLSFYKTDVYRTPEKDPPIILL